MMLVARARAPVDLGDARELFLQLGDVTSVSRVAIDGRETKAFRFEARGVFIERAAVTPGASIEIAFEGRDTIPLILHELRERVTIRMNADAAEGLT